MFGILVAVSALAVEQFGDRETVVAPPDSIAEQFTRSVMARRWEPARQYLENPDARSQDDLEAMQQQFGEGEAVEAELVSRDQERALVTVRLPSRGVVKNFALTFDRSWKITVP